MLVSCYKRCGTQAQFSGGQKFEFLISQGSVATRLRWDGYRRMDFVANFIHFSAMQKVWKSVKISQSYREYKGGNFFETLCSFWRCNVYQHIPKESTLARVLNETEVCPRGNFVALKREMWSRLLLNTNSLESRICIHVLNFVFSALKTYTVNRKTPKCFLLYSLQNLTNCDKIWYILSWVNSSYRNANVFCLTWIVSLPYLVKPSIHVFASEQQLELWTEKHIKCICHIFLQNEADSDKVWYIFSWLNLP